MGKIEKADKSVEEAAEDLFETIEVHEHENIFDDTFNKIFVAAAEWQREQMLKDAVEGEIQMRYIGCLCATTTRAINEDKFKLGDKVRIIIVKE